MKRQRGLRRPGCKFQPTACNDDENISRSWRRFGQQKRGYLMKIGQSAHLARCIRRVGRDSARGREVRGLTVRSSFSLERDESPSLGNYIRQ